MRGGGRPGVCVCVCGGVSSGGKTGFGEAC